MIRIASIVCISTMCLSLAVVTKADQQSAQIRAVQQRVASYVSAFNNHDAGALAKHWTEQAEYIHPVTGGRIQGRTAIEKAFDELFKAEPEIRLKVSSQSLRLVGDHVLIEDAAATVVSPAAPPELAGYTAVHVEQDGQWYRASVRELPVPAAPEATENLKDLAWMIGDWQGDGEDSLMRVRCQWTGGGAFLSRVFADGQIGGTQIIGWDPSTGQIRSWTFDSEGGFSEGLWSWQKDRWVIKATAVMPDGGTGSEQRILVPDGNDRFSWRSVQRQVNGQILPGTDEVFVVRAATQ